MNQELIKKLKDSMTCSGRAERLIDKKIFCEIKTESNKDGGKKKGEKKNEEKESRENEDGRKERGEDIIAFVDGGSAEIFSSASFCFGAIRTAFAAFSGGRKKFQKIFESYIIAKPVGGKNTRCSAEIFEEGERLFENSNLDINLETKQNEISLTPLDEKSGLKSAIGLIRRIAEIRTAMRALRDGFSIIFLDGCLDCNSMIETENMEKLFSDSEEKKGSICALSKTSEIVDVDGAPISLTLSRNSPYKKWFCNADSIKDSIKGFKNSEKSLPNTMTFFSKLNAKSKHAFRVDVRSSAISPEKIFFLLAENSRDASFPGYPYGLIEADRIARISRNEQEYLRNLFSAKIGKIDIEYYTSSLNAHGTLDRMSF